MKRCFNCMKMHEAIYEVCPYCGFVETEYETVPTELKPGSLIAGRYLIGVKQGHGGFGITYAAWDNTLEAKVAVKEYYPNGIVSRNAETGEIDIINDESKAIFDMGLESFLSEAKVLARFNNESEIVHIFDYLEENNTAYIIMEYIEGQTLNEYIAGHGEKGLEIDEAVDIASDIAVALSKLHKIGVIHQDISLENIMKTEDGSLRLLDFGASEDIAGEGYDSNYKVLKHNYAPLEQYDSKEEGNERIDIYALGAVMYHMLTGEAPISALDRKMNKVLREPKEINPDVPDWLNDIVMKCMELYPNDRFKDIAHVLSAIEKKAPIRKEGKKRSKKFVIGFIAIFLALGIVGIVGLGGKGESIDKKDPEVKLKEATFNCEQSMLGTWTFTPILVVENCSNEDVLMAVGVEMVGKNDAGEVVFDETYPIYTFIAPGTANVVTENVQAGGEITSVEYSLVKEQHQWVGMEELHHSEFAPLECYVSYNGPPYGVTIRNNNNYDIGYALVCIIYKDAQGNPVGGYYDCPEMIPAKSEEIYEVIVYDSVLQKYFIPGYTYDIYVQPGIDEML